MKQKELEEILQKEDFNPSSYNLYGAQFDECYVLDQHAGSSWSVFYSELGQRTNEHFFNSEQEACQYIYDKLKKDSSTHK